MLFMDLLCRITTLIDRRSNCLFDLDNVHAKVADGKSCAMHMLLHQMQVLWWMNMLIHVILQRCKRRFMQIQYSNGSDDEHDSNNDDISKIHLLFPASKSRSGRAKRMRNVVWRPKRLSSYIAHLKTLPWPYLVVSGSNLGVALGGMSAYHLCYVQTKKKKKKPRVRVFHCCVSPP